MHVSAWLSLSLQSERCLFFFCFFSLFCSAEKRNWKEEDTRGRQFVHICSLPPQLLLQILNVRPDGGAPPKSISRDHSIHSDQCEIIHKKIQTASQERSSNMQKRIHRRRQLWALRSRWINIYWILSHVSACLQHSAIMQIRYTNVKSLWSSSFTFTK